MTNSSALNVVLNHAREHAVTSRVAVVFDLDSTLFCVAPRTEHILRSLGADRDFALAHPELARALAAIDVRPHDYSVKTIVARLGVRLAEDAIQAVRTYWHAHFFANDHLHRDLVYPGAAEFVNAIAATGAEIIYLTGRGELNMRTGTERALDRHRFPLEPGKLLMKPTEVLSDEGFKAGVLRELQARFETIWFFENEPVIINEVRAMVPRVRIVFVRSAHSRKAAEPTDLLTISPDYRVNS